MASETDETFTTGDEKDAAIAYWQNRCFEAERLRDLDREYIEDLYAMRDAGI